MLRKKIVLWIDFFYGCSIDEYVDFITISNYSLFRSISGLTWLDLKVQKATMSFSGAHVFIYNSSFY